METPSDDSKITVPVIKDLAHNLNHMIKLGYDQNFKVTGEKLMALETEKEYNAEELTVINFYRYEGASDPGDNSILYVIESNDGAKGTLIDAYGAYSDAAVEKFMKRVKIVEK